MNNINNRYDYSYSEIENIIKEILSVIKEVDLSDKYDNINDIIKKLELYIMAKPLLDNEDKALLNNYLPLCNQFRYKNNVNKFTLENFKCLDELSELLYKNSYFRNYKNHIVFKFDSDTLKYELLQKKINTLEKEKDELSIQNKIEKEEKNNQIKKYKEELERLKTKLDNNNSSLKNRHA